jgi:hypothetical protein
MANYAPRPFMGPALEAERISFRTLGAERLGMSTDGVKAGRAYVELSVKDRSAQGLTRAKERLAGWAQGLAADRHGDPGRGRLSSSGTLARRRVTSPIKAANSTT